MSDDRSDSTASDPQAPATVAPATVAPATVALAVSGGIAAYKAVMVARLLKAHRIRVLPLMTASGARFVGAVTLSGICGEPVLENMWDEHFAGEAHVSVADRADVVAIVPCTADLLARLSQGRADDLVAAVALVARGPLVVAPAMHPRMWAHPATRRNVAQLLSDGRATLVGPVHGEVANGDVGYGRMAEPEAIVEVILEQLRAVRSAPRKSQDFASPGAELHGRHIVVTAGPTVEDFDPVRFIGNRSTGKMGFALAAVARERGARVTLISGPVSLPTPAGVTRIDVRGALELQARLDEVLGARLDGADAVIMAAAVADYRPAQVATDKLKKSTDTLTLELVKNPDVIAEVGRRRASTRPVLVAFAVETRDLLENARHKRRNKQVDLVVANTAQDGFGGDHNEVVVVGAEGEPTLRGSKRAVAERILDLVRDRMPAAAST